MSDAICNLCGARGAAARPGRLGRYAVTCDGCEARRGFQPRNHRAEIVAGLCRPTVDRQAQMPSARPTRSR